MAFDCHGRLLTLDNGCKIAGDFCRSTFLCRAHLLSDHCCYVRDPRTAALRAQVHMNLGSGASMAESDADLAAAQAASVRRCAKMTNVGLAALTLSGSLRSLNVSGISAVGPALMKALADSCS